MADTETKEREQNMPESQGGDDGKASQSDAKSSHLIRFGKKIIIDSSKRLPQFDNGIALAYDAYDERAKTKKFIALVCAKDTLCRWGARSSYESLAETSFLYLTDSGPIDWTPERRQKFVFLYNNNAYDPLVPDGGFSSVAWRHPDVVEYFIQPMARMLKEMSDKSFVHGAIRPSNIFHGSVNKDKSVILGDCLSVLQHSTQTSEFLSIERALTDPYGRGRGSTADDIYAFGVSLVHFLRKTDPLEGLSDEEITRRKVEQGSYVALVGTERFQSSFLELLRGILHDDPTQRWKVDDIFSWLDGSRMPPPPHIKRKKAGRPLVVNGQKYMFADTLALDLHKHGTEIAEMVDNGSLARWINKSLDDISLQERYERVIDRISRDGSVGGHDYLITQLRLALYPVLPIRYLNRTFCYDGLGGMLAQDLYNGNNTSFYEEVLKNNICDHSLASAHLPQNELISMVRLFDTCRASIRQKNKVGHGIERCLYMLCRESSCLSDYFDRHFVTGQRSTMMAVEDLCHTKKIQTGLFLDNHIVAFLYVHNSSTVSSFLFDLGDNDKEVQILATLNVFATMQYPMKKTMFPAMGGLFLEALKSASKVYKNRALRKQVQGKLNDAAKAGDLMEMSFLLGDKKSITTDNRKFAMAAQEFRLLQNEYAEYNKRLARKETYGMPNGHDAAALVAWIVATIINVLVVFAYFSGYSIF